MENTLPQQTGDGATRAPRTPRAPRATQERLPGKYGPADGEPLTASAAAARLGAYERVTRAAAGPARAPILYLSDEELAALFAPRQLESLVERPLRRQVAECGAAPH